MKRLLVYLAFVPLIFAGEWAGARYPGLMIRLLPWMMWGAAACSAAGLISVIVAVRRRKDDGNRP